MSIDSALRSAIPAAMFAGLVAIAVTVAIERWGGRIGGLLGTLPTTIVPAAAGILAASASTAEFQAAMAIAPAGMLLNALFLYLWRVLPPRLPEGSLRARLTLMTTLSLGAWLLAAVAVVLLAAVLRESGSELLGIGWLLTLALALLGWAACRHAPAAPAGHRAVGPSTLLARGGLAAAAIGLSVMVAGAGGALAAGIVAVFPAIFLTTMISLWLAQGEAVPAGAVGPMMLGSTSVAVYSLLAAWTLPGLGVAPGTIIAWTVSVLVVTVPAWLWLGSLSKAEVRADDYTG